MIDQIKEINKLWEPVFPYLADFVASIFTKKTGNVAEAGPFCGTIYELCKRKLGERFFLLTFPSYVEGIFKDQIATLGLQNIEIIQTTSSFENIEDNWLDLLFFRGAFFFPEIFKVDLSSVNRILRDGGIAILGGGFGKFTPEEIISKIHGRSKFLNSVLGKKDVEAKEIRSDLKRLGLDEKSELIEDKGLWLILRK